MRYKSLLHIKIVDCSSKLCFYGQDPYSNILVVFISPFLVIAWVPFSRCQIGRPRSGLSIPIDVNSMVHLLRREEYFPDVTTVNTSLQKFISHMAQELQFFLNPVMDAMVLTDPQTNSFLNRYVLYNCDRVMIGKSNIGS